MSRALLFYHAINEVGPKPLGNKGLLQGESGHYYYSSLLANSSLLALFQLLLLVLMDIASDGDEKMIWRYLYRFYPFYKSHSCSALRP
ncbi:hypothetical protein EXN66_Car006077 [Channa argus]|uniref:Uncharacterized protein n=1 Tax=Channa argus TaxID=215402 RepID=A0A6G1PJU3_CHAAH|nr:hypothetical protein EXN66_Car006077 [Channa argus]